VPDKLPGFAWTSSEALARLLDADLRATASARGQAIFDVPSDLDGAAKKAVWDASIGLGFVPGEARKSRRSDPSSFVFKSADEARVTSAVLYQPDVLDSQGEYVTREDLLSAALDYAVRAQKQLGRQHVENSRAGDVIAVVDWPFPVRLQGRTLKAGTVFTVSKWDEEAWADVKVGKIRGLSLGGKATRIPDRA
jgi:hypothetical protein